MKENVYMNKIQALTLMKNHENANFSYVILGNHH